MNEEIKILPQKMIILNSMPFHDEILRYICVNYKDKIKLINNFFPVSTFLSFFYDNTNILSVIDITSL